MLQIEKMRSKARDRWDFLNDGGISRLHVDFHDENEGQGGDVIRITIWLYPCSHVKTIIGHVVPRSGVRPGTRGHPLATLRRRRRRLRVSHPRLRLPVRHPLEPKGS